MNSRVAIWIGVLALLGLAVWALAGAFPGSMESDFANGRIIYLFVLLALVSSGIIFGPRINFGEATRNIAIWLGIVLVLVLGFTFQTELRFVWQRVTGELIPGYAVQTQPGELVLSEARDGHFHVIGSVNGVDVDFLVDTGASDTVLSPADARRAGYDFSGLDFSRVYQTANGFGTGAPVTLDTFAIGSIEFRDFPASINGEEMDSSLLGMSFLRTLESFEIRDRRLYLRW